MLRITQRSHEGICMQFEELTAGRVIKAGPRAVTEQEIVEFARRYDPQYFHIDPARAATSRWGGLIASGWMTAGIAMELTVSAVLKDSRSVGSPGIEKLEWRHPVRPGDSLRLEITVLESRISKSGAVGVVRWAWTLYNQNNIVVLNMTATSLFDIT
jgi:acyl dehydratase